MPPFLYELHIIILFENFLHLSIIPSHQKLINQTKKDYLKFVIIRTPPLV